MFQIVLMVCLAATGENCREFKLTDKDYESVVTCIRDSHAKGAAWQTKNEKYTLVGTRCAKDPKVQAAP